MSFWLFVVYCALIAVVVVVTIGRRCLLSLRVVAVCVLVVVVCWRSCGCCVLSLFLVRARVVWLSLSCSLMCLFVDVGCCGWFLLFERVAVVCGWLFTCNLDVDWCLLLLIRGCDCLL